MRGFSTVLCAAVFLSLGAPRPAFPQADNTSQQLSAPYTFKMPVDEVSLAFRAADAHGLPVNDLKAEELSLLDNGKPPRRIVSFSLLQDVPIRAGILLDTSESMANHLSTNRAIAIEFVQRVQRLKADQAFVMEFGYISKITQTWTNDPSGLTHAIREAVTGGDNPLGGTALFDTIFRACFNVFRQIDHSSGGNFILLFSDGKDNGSHTSLPDVVDVCQKSNTAIYAFRAEPDPSLFSAGPRVLSDIAAKTGGRAFPSAHSEAEVDSDLRTIDADMKNQYRLIYNPMELEHDGSFHRIELKTPERVESVTIRSGYYDLPR